MLEADHLTVSGDVSFGKDVSLKVSIIYHDQPEKKTFFKPSEPSVNQDFRERLSLLPTTVTVLTSHQEPFWRTRSFPETCAFSTTRGPIFRAVFIVPPFIFTWFEIAPSGQISNAFSFTPAFYRVLHLRRRSALTLGGPFWAALPESFLKFRAV